MQASLTDERRDQQFVESGDTNAFERQRRDDGGAGGPQPVCRERVTCIYTDSLPSLTPTMTIEISPESSKAAIASIQRYFSENLDEEIGSLDAGALLGFFLKEIGPVVYNKAVSDAQTRLQARVMELDVEVYEDEFQYWVKKGQGKRHG